MKILLVRPKPSSETIGLQHVMVVEPLELEILSALKRPQDSTVLVDMILEKNPFEFFLKLYQPDVLCVTGYITNVNTIISYCEIAKSLFPEIKTVVGGVHCEVCPDDFKHQSIDYRVVRNATKVFKPLLDFIEFRQNMPLGVLAQDDIFKEDLLPAFDFYIPFPDLSITEKYRKHYFYIFHKNVALIKTSFGCPYKCSFCFCREITRNLYNQRPLEEVLDELELKYEKEIYVVDDDFLTDRKRLELFVKGVKTRKIQKHYLVYGRADFIAQNPDLMEQLRGIGLKTVIVGFESFYDSDLEKYQKKISKNVYQETMKVLNRLKIDCFATIIVSPDWDKNDFKKLVNATKELGIHFVNLQPLTPLPGTGISFASDQILIKKEEYEKWDLAHVTIKPTKLTTPEFYKQILISYNAIVFRPAAIWIYLKKYPLPMLIKMIIGSRKVAKQYKQKIKEAENHA